MTNAETPVWRTYDHAPTRWAVVGSLVIAWLLACLFLYSDVAKILAARPWWEDFIVALATVAVPILAFLELRHSAEANEQRCTANELRREQIALEDRLGQLMVERDMERNKHLEQIASNTLRRKTSAERNAEILRRHAGHCVSVTEGQGAWPSTPLIAEVSGANIVTLFDESNSFLLEASTGKRVVADNVEMSKRFALLAVDYLAAGFSRGNSGTSGSTHRLYIPMF